MILFILKIGFSQKNGIFLSKIVDLIRNDLGKVSLLNSVEVSLLFHIESYQMVHQMVTTVISELSPQYDSFDTIEACFPPGSMTGAPKQRSVDLLMKLEGLDENKNSEDKVKKVEINGKRGIYSGVAGWISFNNCLDLNVIIRTAVIKNKSYFFVFVNDFIIFY